MHQDDLLRSLRAEAEAAAAGAFAPAAPSEAAAPLPEPSTAFYDADYRQEILEIERIQATRELDALPRAVVASLPRVTGAPDITLPVDGFTTLHFIQPHIGHSSLHTKDTEIPL